VLTAGPIGAYSVSSVYSVFRLNIGMQSITSPLRSRYYPLIQYLTRECDRLSPLALQGCQASYIQYNRTREQCIWVKSRIVAHETVHPFGSCDCVLDELELLLAV